MKRTIRQNWSEFMTFLGEVQWKAAFQSCQETWTTCTWNRDFFYISANDRDTRLPARLHGARGLRLLFRLCFFFYGTLTHIFAALYLKESYRGLRKRKRKQERNEEDRQAALGLRKLLVVYAYFCHFIPLFKECYTSLYIWCYTPANLCWCGIALHI